jgi:arylformamidase
MKLVDLSHPFDPTLYPPNVDGQQVNLEMRRLRTVEEHGVNTLQITFGNHIGTHLDVPLHLLAAGKSVDEIPLETFYGTAVVLDIPKGPNGGVDRADLERAEPNVMSGDIAVICCGWGDKLSASNYASHHPYLTEDGADWLVAKQVRMVGMDVQSVDLPHSLRESGFSYTSLRILLRHGIPVMHNLTNLQSLRGTRVMLFALPVNFHGADGAPARIVAQVER